MKRVGRLLFHNWPLKLAAIVLATMLYAGFVLSQSALELNDRVKIEAIGLPTTASLTDNLPEVTLVRYFAVGDASARASADSFQATIDLENVDPSGGPHYVQIDVKSRDPRFTVTDWEPRGITVALDPLRVRTNIPVRIVQGTVPEGLDVRTPVTVPDLVSIRGPASVVDRVAEVLANVQIEPSGLDVDRDVELVPVDALGDRVTRVDVEPATAHIRIAVFKSTRSRPLPVTPVLSGAPAPGYQVTGIAVDPLIISVEGDADAILGLTEAATAAVQVSGATQDVSQLVGLALPEGVQPAGGDIKVRVTVTIRPIGTTRSFDAAIQATGREAGLEYRLSVDHAVAIVGGPLADLDSLDGSVFTLSAPVGGLGPGIHVVALRADLKLGLSLVTVTPATVTVTVAAAAPASASP